MANDTSYVSRFFCPAAKTCCNHLWLEQIPTHGSWPIFTVGTGIHERRLLARTHKTIPDSRTIADDTWLRADYRRAHTNRKYDGLNRKCCQYDGTYD